MIYPSAADTYSTTSSRQHTDSSKPEAMRDALSSCRGASMVSVDVDVDVDAKNL